MSTLSLYVLALCLLFIGLIFSFVAGLDWRDYQARTERREILERHGIINSMVDEYHASPAGIANAVLTGRKCLVCGKDAQSTDVAQLCDTHFYEAIRNSPLQGYEAVTNRTTGERRLMYVVRNGRRL